MAGGGVADVRRLAVNEEVMKVIATNGYKKAIKLYARMHTGPVGASSLAMVVNDDVGCLTPRRALRFFASKLAPTGAIGKITPRTSRGVFRR
jgi:hypothetical protein